LPGSTDEIPITRDFESRRKTVQKGRKLEGAKLGFRHEPKRTGRRGSQIKDIPTAAGGMRKGKKWCIRVRGSAGVVRKHLDKKVVANAKKLQKDLTAGKLSVHP